MGKNDLDSLRKDIAQIDDSILDLLIKRFELTDEVGRIKNKANIPIENKDVEKKIFDRLVLKAVDKLDGNFVTGVYTQIFTESKERQKKV